MIPIRTTVNPIPLYVYGEFTGNVDINTVATHTFTFVKLSSTGLKPNTKYQRIVQFDLAAVTNIDEIVSISFPQGEEVEGNIGIIIRNLVGINDDFTEHIHATSLITTNTLAVDTFAIITINNAATSLGVSFMNAIYMEVRY